jgi:hypothetical protein
MFDKYVDYSYHPYEKYFRNIYNAMNIYFTPQPITPLPLLGGKNNNKIYKQKYRKYKQKYLELKNK